MTAYSIDATDKEPTYGWEALKPTHDVSDRVFDIAYADELWATYNGLIDKFLAIAGPEGFTQEQHQELGMALKAWQDFVAEMDRREGDARDRDHRDDLETQSELRRG